MTSFELNAEIYRNLGYLANDEGYLRKALALLKELVGQKKSAVKTTHTIKKIKVKETTLPGEEFVGIFSKNREDDKKLLDEYLMEKYQL